MCRMLYLATADDQPLRTIRFIGAHTRCSCGFPSVSAEQPIEYYDGMLGEPGEISARSRR